MTENDDFDLAEKGHAMYQLCCRLFPLPRSITGDGFRASLSILREHVPGLQVFEVPSGTRCFDWEVPPEWNIRDAYIIDPDGNKICDFREHNLHVLNYATPVDQEVSLNELQDHLYSNPDLPQAIPYVTSYYNERWGFCISHEQRQTLQDGIYRVFIDSELAPGSLTYGELLLQGDVEQEVLLSTYLCHPSMANNELSGPVVTTYLAKWLSARCNRYSYRIVIIPESIGSIVYLSRNLKALKKNTIAGFNLSCIGDDRTYSYLSSRAENTLSDQVAKHVLKHHFPPFHSYPFKDGGSDERRYCSPGVDLPVCSIMRSKYGTYPEYHSSLDNLELVSPSGLAGGYHLMRRMLLCIEMNDTLLAMMPGEPQLGKRGLYPTLGTKKDAHVKNMMNLLAYSDGLRDLVQIAEKIGVPMWELWDIANKLKAHALLESIDSSQ